MKKYIPIFVILILLLAIPAMAAFPDGWGRSAPIVTQNAQVAATQTSFVLLLSQDCLPAEMFDAGLCQPDGGDIRFSSDSTGATRLACSIVNYDTIGTNFAEIHVGGTAFSHTVDDTLVWIWYDSSSSEQPAIDAAYGAEAVWVDYEAVWHLESDPTGTNYDATSSDADMTSAGGMVSGNLITGKIGKGIDFEGGADDRLTSAAVSQLKQTGDVTFSCWFDSPNGASQNIFFNEPGVAETEDENSIVFIMSGSGSAYDVLYIHEYSAGSNEVNDFTNYDAPASGWTYLTVTRDVSANTVIVYKNGATVTGGTFNYTNDPTCTGTLSAASLGARTNGSNASVYKADEFRFRAATVTLEDALTAYNNQNSPSTFVVEGTPYTPPSGGAGGNLVKVRK